MRTTKPYKIYFTQTSQGDNIASVRITRDGSIKTIVFMLAGVAGGSTGSQQVELSKQSTRNISTNDTPPSVIGEACITYPVINAAASLSLVTPWLNIPVSAGDNLYVHQTINGTAPTSSLHTVQMYVNE